MKREGYIVIDLETQKTFEEAGGRNCSQLGVSVCVLYDYGRDQYFHYLESELGRLENHLINSQLVIGFNIRKFDLPVLQPYFSLPIERLPVFDIMEDLTQKIGHRIGLDSVAQATLNIGKTAKGLDAIRFYREGRWEELKSYCENDVRITKEVFDYGLEHEEVFYLSRDGTKKIRVEVDWMDRMPRSPKLVEQAQYKLF